MSRTRRNRLFFRKRPQNLNPEPINRKTNIRKLSFEKRQELGLVLHAIYSATKSGYLDHRELTSGRKLKRWAKRFVHKSLRRYGKKELKIQ